MDEFTGQGTPVSAGGFAAAIAALGLADAQAAALWSVLAVETAGCGYLVDRRPKILFERHYFHQFTDGQFDAVDPDVSAPTAGGYGAGGANQYVRLAAALQLDRESALKSASWGLGQIMGSNFQAAGFADVDTMVAAFVAGEDAQLAGMAAFVAAGQTLAALQQQDWTTFARLYNGPNYAQNHYDDQLAAHYARFVSQGCPDLTVRAAQVKLFYLSYNTGGIDGLVGAMTTQALQAYQQQQGLAPADGTLNDATLAALMAA